MTLPRLTEFVLLATDKHMFSLLIIINFSKAFASIPHAPLLRKLRLLGCTDQMIRRFAAYLQGREQAVLSVEDNTSYWAMTSSGVP